MNKTKINLRMFIYNKNLEDITGTQLSDLAQRQMG